VATCESAVGHNAFAYNGNMVAPVIRVLPGGVIKLHYANNLSIQSEDPYSSGSFPCVRGEHEAVGSQEWLDTVNVPYGGSVDLIMDFTDLLIRGMSLFHCHLPSHEDKGMMAKIQFE
jgi:FtsP/CotA-like multicopper oxidase with cupredoxin domain